LVLNGVPFQVSCVAAVNPEPFAVRVNSGLPATTVLGVMLVKLNGALTVNDTAFEVWAELCSVTDAVPGCAIRFAGTMAVACPALTMAVASVVAFHTTVVALSMPEPFTVNVNAGPPALAEAGEMLVSVSGAVIVNVTAEGDACPGVATVTGADPGDAIRAAGTPAVNWFADTKVVVNPVPFQRT
jgi:hypothetical protein